ncbi:unnamed protein product, partial [marine sediment metagenome]
VDALIVDFVTEAEAVQAVEDTGLVLSAGKVITSQDANLEFLLGRTKIGFVDFVDYAGFGHRDMDGGGYALIQSAAGNTHLNAEDGRSITFKIHNIKVMQIIADALTMRSKIICM